LIGWREGLELGCEVGNLVGLTEVGLVVGQNVGGIEGFTVGGQVGDLVNAAVT